MSGEWFRRFVPAGGPAAVGGDAVGLVCFPHAGGAASAFRQLSGALGSGVDVVAVQYPGRQERRREPALDDIGLLADAIASEVSAQLPGRYAFFGHSMGAVVAHETVLRLVERGLPGPVRLFLSGRGAPPEVGRHDRLCTDAEILAMVRRLGGTAAAVFEDPDILAMVMPTLRADYRALGSYVWTPRPPLDVPFTVLIGDRDPVVPVSAVSGWKDFTTAGADIRVFEGGHFFLDAHVDEVAREVVAALDLTRLRTA